MRALVTTLLAFSTLTACAFTAPVTCPEDQFDDPPTDAPALLTCDVAVAAARPSLAGVAGITALRFEYSNCPPNARCPAPSGHVGAVIATLGGGDELYVMVRIEEDGSVHIEEPQHIDPHEPAGGG